MSLSCKCVQEEPHCAQCLGTNDLIMLPNRREGKFVGQTFVCRRCAGSLSDLEIEVRGAFAKTVVAA